MLTKRGNYHHSKLPELGAIGYLVRGTNRFGEVDYFDGKPQRYQVVAFPLVEDAGPMPPGFARPLGIHTAYFRNLATGAVRRAAGFYFDADGDAEPAKPAGGWAPLEAPASRTRLGGQIELFAGRRP